MASDRNNRPSLDDIRTMPVGEIAKLPAEHLALLQDDADAALDAAKRLKEWLEGAIALRYAEAAATVRRAEGKDTGLVRFEDGTVIVAADLPKKVDWDQSLPHGSLNQRQRWYLDALAAGKEVRADDLRRRWDVSEKTARRDVAALKKRGMIEFVGSFRRGRYRLLR